MSTPPPLPTRPLPSVGTLVHARDRDWVVLPPADDPGVARLRPITGDDAETIGIHLALEHTTAATFAPPDPAQHGDLAAAGLLFDAARLGLRDGAAPFRCLGRIAVRPRAYQFVPLVMALRQRTTRLLVADDVGVGKTIEAALVARELLDRGVARRLAVICPAHLCDQWERELRDKFGIEAAVIQPARFARLERDLPRSDIDIFQYHRHLICSIDFIKAHPRADRFIASAPDLVIVDEAHGVARPGGAGDRSRHQRYEFLRTLVRERNPHLLLVSATPHSGVESSFRSLLGLLDPALDTDAPLANEALIPLLVQRRRADLRAWPEAAQAFPQRIASEAPYRLGGDYYQLFHDVLAYCRQAVEDSRGASTRQQRVRYWAALALLRGVLSSPRAASEMLAARARKRGEEVAPTDAPDDVDATYRREVLDPFDDEVASDLPPTAPLEAAAPALPAAEHRRLGDFQRRAAAIAAAPASDAKLVATAQQVAALLAQGHHPIVFCYYIPTAKYVAEHLPALLKKQAGAVRAVAVTGELGDEERRAAIADLVDHRGPRVLVATDCLSEGINLQERFDAVVHYDLPWNPNRLEQREGRIDRFGQPRPEVRTVVVLGHDNPIDGVIWDVLLRKSRVIRDRLGVDIPIPADSEHVVQAVLESVLLRGTNASARQLGLDLGAATAEVAALDRQLDAAVDAELARHKFFAQHAITPEAIQRELESADPVLGDEEAIRRFLGAAALRFNGSLTPHPNRPGVWRLEPGDLAPKLADRGFAERPLVVRLDGVAVEGVVALGRAHPIVATFAAEALGRALGPTPDRLVARAGAYLTRAVERRTVLVVARARYTLREAAEEFAEEIVLAAFQWRDGRIAWLEPFDRAGLDLLQAATGAIAGNLPNAERAEHVRWALDRLAESPDWHAPIVARRQQTLQDAHTRIRALTTGGTLEVRPHTPLDILGCYVLVPAQ